MFVLNILIQNLFPFFLFLGVENGFNGWYHKFMHVDVLNSILDVVNSIP
jgi:hypothetical protein